MKRRVGDCHCYGARSQPHCGIGFLTHSPRQCYVEDVMVRTVPEGELRF